LNGTATSPAYRIESVTESWDKLQSAIKSGDGGGVASAMDDYLTIVNGFNQLAYLSTLAAAGNLAKLGSEAISAAAAEEEAASSASSSGNGTEEIKLSNGNTVSGIPTIPANAPSAPTPRIQLSPEAAEQYLVSAGVPAGRVAGYLASFDGPIYFREALPGETFGVYSDATGEGTAQFLTPGTAGQNPGEVVSNLALPETNAATRLNAATINQPIGVLEGVIAPQEWNGSVSGGGWQIFVPGGSQFGTKPVTIGAPLK
jgi:hypothetical protein